MSIPRLGGAHLESQTQKVGVGDPEFKAILDYMNPCLKKEK